MCLAKPVVLCHWLVFLEFTCDYWLSESGVEKEKCVHVFSLQGSLRVLRDLKEFRHLNVIDCLGFPLNISISFRLKVLLSNSSLIF